MALRALRPRAAECHPMRRAHMGGLCKPCWQGRRVEPKGPPIITGIGQRALTEFPPDCYKCGAPPPAWRIDARYAKCLICGADVFLSSGRVITLKAALDAPAYVKLPKGRRRR